MNSTQTNTRSGNLPMATASDLTGKEGFLAALGSSGLALPAAITDRTPYLLEEIEDASNAVAQPISPERNFRAFAKGTGSKGDVLVLADPGTAADAGKLRALPAGAGTYHSVAIAEEDFVDGQLVLARKIDREAIVVS